MKLICTMPVRNEDWCLGLTLRAVLMWVDEVVVLDHCSTDRTCEIIGDVMGEHEAGRVEFRHATNPVWTEMENHQLCLQMARERGATHIARIDADEILTGNCLPLIRDWIELAPAYPIVQLPWLQLNRSIWSVHNSGIWGSSEVSMAFKDSLELHWTVQGEEKYDHHHRHPMGRQFQPYRPTTLLETPRAIRSYGLLHLQMANDRRFLLKQYWYQLVERVRWPKKSVADIRTMYARSVYAHTTNPAGAPVPEEWWEPYSHLMKYLDLDVEPWYAADIRRMLKENPGIEKGLDSFGLEF